MTRYRLKVEGYKAVEGELAAIATQPPAAGLPYWRHKDDKEMWGRLRTCVPCPAVFPMSDHKVPVTRQWQYFIRAINAKRELSHVAALFGPALAFTNRRKDDTRRDWLKLENMDRPDPDFDRVRTMSLSTLTGTEAYSLMEALHLTGTSLIRRDFAGLRRSFASMTANNVLRVTMMDGWKDPPLKAGRSYPQRVADINLDDYLYTPQTYRHLFFAANITNGKGETAPFPNGAIYDWTGDGQPYTWMPHVSRRVIEYPLANLVRLPAGSPAASPYRLIQ